MVIQLATPLETHLCLRKICTDIRKAIFLVHNDYNPPAVIPTVMLPEDLGSCSPPSQKYDFSKICAHARLCLHLWLSVAPSPLLLCCVGHMHQGKESTSPAHLPDPFLSPQNNEGCLYLWCLSVWGSSPCDPIALISQYLRLWREPQQAEEAFCLQRVALHEANSGGEVRRGQTSLWLLLLFLGWGTFSGTSVEKPCLPQLSNRWVHG